MKKKNNPGWEEDLLEEVLPPIPDTGSDLSNLANALQNQYDAIVAKYKMQLIQRKARNKMLQRFR